jgi:hypothetical protein
LSGNAKIGCSSMSRCGLVCFGMQVPGSAPGDSQRVEGVAVIDTEPARNLPTGNVSEGWESEGSPNSRTRPTSSLPWVKSRFDAQSVASPSRLQSHDPCSERSRPRRIRACRHGSRPILRNVPLERLSLACLSRTRFQSRTDSSGRFPGCNCRIAPTGLVRIDGGPLLLLTISRSFTKMSVILSPENEELAAFDLTTC